MGQSCWGPDGAVVFREGPQPVRGFLRQQINTMDANTSVSYSNVTLLLFSSNKGHQLGEMNQYVGAGPSQPPDLQLAR